MNSPSDAPAVELRSVSKRYGDRLLFDRLSMRIARGELVALLGESGAGKSTLLNLVAGLERPDEGEVLVGGTPIQGLDADGSAALRRRQVGFVFQAFHLLPHMDAAHNVAVPLMLEGAREREALDRARAMLARVGLAQREAALPRELSGGEQQRVALARALVHAPALVLADEPTGNLDPATAQRALEVIEEQVRASGAALLMVTHSSHAAEIADRRLVLASGSLAEG